MKKILIVLICLICLSGCSSSSSSNGDTINYVEAKEKIINNGAILVDVRTEDEYNENHIDGAVLLPLDDIREDSASETIGDKDSIIIVYCQSGERSHQALEKLKSLGYREVYDLGAMANWK